MAWRGKAASPRKGGHPPPLTLDMYDMNWRNMAPVCYAMASLLRDGALVPRGDVVRREGNGDATAVRDRAVTVNHLVRTSPQPRAGSTTSATRSRTASAFSSHHR